MIARGEQAHKDEEDECMNFPEKPAGNLNGKGENCGRERVSCVVCQFRSLLLLTHQKTAINQAAALFLDEWRGFLAEGHVSELPAKDEGQFYAELCFCCPRTASRVARRSSRGLGGGTRHRQREVSVFDHNLAVWWSVKSQRLVLPCDLRQHETASACICFQLRYAEAFTLRTAIRSTVQTVPHRHADWYTK